MVGCVLLLGVCALSVRVATALSDGRVEIVRPNTDSFRKLLNVPSDDKTGGHVFPSAKYLEFHKPTLALLYF